MKSQHESKEHKENKTKAVKKKINKPKHDIKQNARQKEDKKKAKRQLRPLNGITIAVSTLDTGKKHESEENSYKYVIDECKAAGAVVTGQVGKKVFAVVCNRSAVLQCTQRVRKALKRNVMLLDISWVRDSVIEGRRLEHEEYLLNDLATEIFSKKEEADKDDKNSDVDGEPNDVEFISVDDVGIVPGAGWSEPVSYGCCCVCHENGDIHCKWCTDPLCDLNAAEAKAKAEKEK